MTSHLSKSRFLWGLQCPKLLWTAFNAGERIPPTDEQTQAVFDQGHEVELLARKLFPGGIEVGQDDDGGLEEALRLSQEAIKARRPLFEATFAYQGGFARADILEPVAGDAWDIIEVKSGTSIKDVYIFDLAFQTFVYAGAGLKVRHCFLLIIDGDYVRQRDIDPAKLFKMENVTAMVSSIVRQLEPNLDKMFQTIRLQGEPEIQIGPHCDDPYTCPLHDRCWSFLPPHNVLTLYRGGKKRFKLLANGITKINDIPAEIRLTAKQLIQQQAVISGTAHVSTAAITRFLRKLKYPVSYLDFETLATAVPLFEGTRPFQQVPFQFSLHVVRSPNCKPEHHMFLAEGRGDPRPQFLQRLRDCLPVTGSIVAYNAAFELSRLRECAAALQEFHSWVAGVEDRTVDLLQPFRRFSYYHPGQNGSASMKAVLPALTSRGYDHLDIQEGGTASLEFLRVTFDDVDEAERQLVRRQLEEYCGRDTEGMIWIVEALEKLSCGAGLNRCAVIPSSC